MKINCFLIILSMFLLPGFNYGQYEMDDTESFSRVAGYLHEQIQIDNKPYIRTGSCFFVHTELNSYLVTAEHISKNCTLNTKITFSAPDYTPITYKLTEIVKNKSKLNWTIHPQADVATILLDSAISKKLPSVPIEQISRKLDSPKREHIVTVFGFPLSLGVGKKISAISKTSKPASGLIELPRFDTKINSVFYLLDDPGVSGFSGGPVIQLLPEIGGIKFDLEHNKNINKVIGIVHGSISDPKAGGGFSAITPSAYVVENILNSPGYSGILKYKYPNGNIWSEVKYINGRTDTVLSNFDSKGIPQEKGTLKNGNGTRYVYDENGKLLMILYYENGLTIKTEHK